MVKPAKQLENMPKAVKDILVGSIGNQIIPKAINLYTNYKGREVMKTVHKEALDKVMHGSINNYFDVTPVGRVIKLFNS